jgi:hypothetical protein
MTMTPSDLVTPAMVEAACLSRYGGYWDELSAESRDFGREDMRDAISAALEASALPFAVDFLEEMERFYSSKPLSASIACLCSIALSYLKGTHT